MIELAIGIPTHGDIKADTVRSLLPLYHFIPYPIQYIFAKGTYVHKNRNEIVERAQKSGSTHLMFIDSDMVFTYKDIGLLIHRDVDIIGANYNRREMPSKDTVIFENKSLLLPNISLVKCNSIATGFILIKMSVFDKLNKPYFDFEYDGDRMVGEDVYFCRRAKEAGFDVWCDLSIKVKHIGDYLY